MKFGPKEIKQLNEYLRTGRNKKREFLGGNITFASDLVNPDPRQDVIEIDAINSFMKRNPMAGGGMLVQPGFGGTRQGYKKDGFNKMNLERRLKAYDDLKKTYGKKIIEDAFKKDYGTSFEKIAGKKEYKGRTVTNIIDGFKKKIKGINRSSATSPIYNEKTGHIYKTSNRFGTFYSQTPGKNQYAPMRSLEDVQKAIDNAPQIEIDGKLFDQNPKDLTGRSEFSGKEIITRKEYEKYKDKLKIKGAGKKRIVPVTQAYYDRRARELAKSNPTILKKLSGKGGYQLSHLSLSELDSLKNLGYLPAEINLKQYFPFEKKIVEISQQVYETQNNKKLSIEEKRAKIAELQKKDRALRKQFPEFAKTKARLNVRATGLDSSGLMIKEKLPDPSIAIAPTEAGTQLKGTAIGSEKGKALLDFGKNNLQKLAAIGCPGKAMGGRIGFFEGQNLNACAARGLDKLQTTDIKKLTPGDKANVKAITKTVQGGRILKNVLGPGALAFEGLFAAPFAAYDFARGRPGEDIFKNALSLGLLNQKLTDAELRKIFPEYGQAENLQNIGDRLTNLERLQKGTRGQKLRSKPKFEKTEEQFETALQSFLDTGDPQKAFLENIKKSQDAEKELDRQYNIRKQNRTTQFDLSDPFMAAKGGRAGFASGTGGYDKPSHRQYLKDIESDLHRSFKRYKRIYGGKMKFNQYAPKFLKENLASGGLAGIKSGPPPEKGPNSQGLLSLMKRGMKI